LVPGRTACSGYNQSIQPNLDVPGIRRSWRLKTQSVVASHLWTRSLRSSKYITTLYGVHHALHEVPHPRFTGVCMLFPWRTDAGTRNVHAATPVAHVHHARMHNRHKRHNSSVMHMRHSRSRLPTTGGGIHHHTSASKSMQGFIRARYIQPEPGFCLLSRPLRFWLNNPERHCAPLDVDSAGWTARVALRGAIRCHWGEVRSFAGYIRDMDRMSIVGVRGRAISPRRVSNLHLRSGRHGLPCLTVSGLDKAGKHAVSISHEPCALPLSIDTGS
jgi:hypothetical protein